MGAGLAAAGRPLGATVSTAWSAAGRGTVSKRHCSNSFFFIITIIIIIIIYFFYLWGPKNGLQQYVSSKKDYMVSNKHLVLGLRNFLLWSLLLYLFLVVTILLFLLTALMQVISLCIYVMMTWLLLVMTLMKIKFWRQSTLARQFEIKDLDYLWYFLCIEVA
jgi:small-conductance mechanosensitive channel